MHNDDHRASDEPCSFLTKRPLDGASEARVGAVGHTSPWALHGASQGLKFTTGMGFGL